MRVGKRQKWAGKRKKTKRKRRKKERNRGKIILESWNSRVHVCRRRVVLSSIAEAYGLHTWMSNMTSFTAKDKYFWLFVIMLKFILSYQINKAKFFWDWRVSAISQRWFHFHRIVHHFDMFSCSASPSPLQRASRHRNSILFSPSVRWRSFVDSLLFRAVIHLAHFDKKGTLWAIYVRVIENLFLGSRRNERKDAVARAEGARDAAKSEKRKKNSTKLRITPENGADLFEQRHRPYESLIRSGVNQCRQLSLSARYPSAIAQQLGAFLIRKSNSS